MFLLTCSNFYSYCIFCFNDLFWILCLSSILFIAIYSINLKFKYFCLSLIKCFVEETLKGKSNSNTVYLQGVRKWRTNRKWLQNTKIYSFWPWIRHFCSLHIWKIYVKPYFKMQTSIHDFKMGKNKKKL